MTVEDNEIYGNDVGIHVSQETSGRSAIDAFIHRNQIHDNRRFGIFFYDGATSGSIGSGAIRTQSNVIWKNGIGIQVGRGSTNKTMVSETAYANLGDGIKIGEGGLAAAAGVVSNSLLTNNGRYGFELVAGSKATISYTGLSGNVTGSIGGSPTKIGINTAAAGYLSTTTTSASFLRISTSSYQYTAGSKGGPVGPLIAAPVTDRGARHRSRRGWRSRSTRLGRPAIDDLRAQDDPGEPRGIAEVTPPQASRLLDEAVRPLEPGALHPARRALDLPGIDVERTADAHHEGGSDPVLPPRQEGLLGGRTDGHEQDVRPSLGDRGNDLRLRLRRPVPVPTATDDRPRVIAFDARSDRAHDVRTRTQQVQPVATLPRPLDQPFHQIHAGHSLAQRCAQQA